MKFLSRLTLVVDGYSLIDFKKTENISLCRQAFTDHHGSFLRSERKCLPYNFLTENVYLYNIIMML